MKSFPNKMIAEAYAKAQGKVFNKHTHDGTYIDQEDCEEYNHHALQWLEEHGVLAVELNRNKWVFEYRIVK